MSIIGFEVTVTPTFDVKGLLDDMIEVSRYNMSERGHGLYANVASFSLGRAMGHTTAVVDLYNESDEEFIIVAPTVSALHLYTHADKRIWASHAFHKRTFTVQHFTKDIEGGRFRGLRKMPSILFDSVKANDVADVVYALEANHNIPDWIVSIGS